MSRLFLKEICDEWGVKVMMWMVVRSFWNIMFVDCFCCCLLNCVMICFLEMDFMWDFLIDNDLGFDLEEFDWY